MALNIAPRTDPIVASEYLLMIAEMLVHREPMINAKFISL